LNYGVSVQIPIFKCQWVKHPQGVEINDYGFTIVDLTNVGHKDEPWVLAVFVAQVFYILDPKDEKKYTAVPRKQRVVGGNYVEDEEEYKKCDEVSFFVDTRRINIVETKISYSNVILYARTDGEGKLLQTTITNYYKLLLFWIYLHPEVVIVFIAAVLIGAPVTFGGVWFQ
jgi:hypothetical protein